MPAASALGGSEKLAGVQGSGCATSTAPCSNVAVTPAQIATYVAGASPITSAYQPLDADLTTIAALSASNDDFVQRKSGAWTNRTITQVRQDLNASYVFAKSGVAVSHTGDTTETTLATITLPAGAMGPNGQVEIVAMFSFTSSANNKTPRIYFGGTNILLINVTTSGYANYQRRIANRNSASSQIADPTGATGFGTNAGSVTTAAIDTTSSVSISITCQNANSGDTCTLESYIARVTYGA